MYYFNFYIFSFPGHHNEGKLDEQCKEARCNQRGKCCLRIDSESNDGNSVTKKRLWCKQHSSQGVDQEYCYEGERILLYKEVKTAHSLLLL